MSSHPALPADLEDEIAAVNSIYTADTLKLVAPSSSDSASHAHTLTLTLPTSPLTLRLSFPATYPGSSPSLLGVESVGASAPKGYGTSALELARIVLAETWREGDVVVYDFLTRLEEELPSDLSARLEDSSTAETGDQPAEGATAHNQASGPVEDSPDFTPGWIIAEPIQEKKSVFQARACRVSSRAEVLSALSSLRTSDRKLARATHHISAYRIRSASLSSSQHPGGDRRVPPEVTFQESDDDGETAAGGKVMGVMTAMGIWGWLVVVSRWYGGIKLGPDRFRIIGAASRAVLVMVSEIEEREAERMNGKR